jgi:hypothetical protein
MWIAVVYQNRVYVFVHVRTVVEHFQRKTNNIINNIIIIH